MSGNLPVTGNICAEMLDISNKMIVKFFLPAVKKT